MKMDAIECNPELQQVLWACYTYWKSETLPVLERIICYSWVLPLYEGRFHKRFHQSKLHHLSKLGFLKPDATSRGGHRRYYSLVDPDRVRALLEKWSSYDGT